MKFIILIYNNFKILFNFKIKEHKVILKKIFNFISAAFELDDNLNNVKYFKLRVSLLILYLWPVILSQHVLTFQNSSSLRRIAVMTLCSAAEILFILLIVCPVIIKFFQQIDIRYEEQHNKIFIKSFLISLGVLLVYYILCYPGTFSYDPTKQYLEAISNKYTDWHPALHTLLFFTLPLKLTFGWMGSIVLLQIILFALALAYMTEVLAYYSNYNYAYISLAFILLNPTTQSISMSPYKDVVFAITAILLMCFALHIYYTHGAWLNNFKNIILFSVILTLATIFRHNAILFTAPLYLAVIIYASKKHAVIIFLLASLLFAFIKIPVYKYFEVEKPGYRQLEMLGVPMAVIGAAVKESPHLLDQDILDFAYKAAPKDRWQDSYITGSFNHIKFDYADKDFIEKTGAVKILKFMLKCFVQAPIASLHGLIAETDTVYGLSGFKSDLILLNSNQNGILSSAIVNLNHFMQVILSLFFGKIGIVNLIILICLLAKFKFKKLFFALPLFAYNFGTMLLLAGHELRFFYYSFAIAPALILILLNDRMN